MPRVGVIAVGRDCADVMDAVLAPWIEAMDRHDIHMCFVMATFKGMEGLLPPTVDRDTAAMVVAKGYGNSRFTWKLFEDYATEAEVREAGRSVLMERGCDLIWMLDLDEFYTGRDIDSILAFVAARPLVPWFRLSLKNYVFDNRTYLVQPFQPPRLWRCKVGDRVLARVSYDNDCVYARPDGADAVEDKALPCVTIPPSVAWVKHLSWMNDARGRLKVVYQTRHFAHGAGCSFGWDDARGGLIWNESYFKKTRQPIPETAQDSS